MYTGELLVVRYLLQPAGLAHHACELNAAPPNACCPLGKQ